MSPGNSDRYGEAFGPKHPTMSLSTLTVHALLPARCYLRNREATRRTRRFIGSVSPSIDEVPPCFPDRPVPSAGIRADTYWAAHSSPQVWAVSQPLEIMLYRPQNPKR